MSTQFSVTSMTSPLSASQHPLFAEPGLYRQGSKLSVWADGGKESIVRFFYEWHREWRSFLWHNRLVTECPTDWAYDEKTNASIVNRLVRDRQRAEEISAQWAAESETAKGETPLPTPQKEQKDLGRMGQQYVGALRRVASQAAHAGGVRADGAFSMAVIIGENIDSTIAGITKDRHRCFVSGLSKPDGNENADRVAMTNGSKEFRFSIAVDAAFAGRRAMMLLVRSSILERIRTVLECNLDEEHFPPSHYPMPEYQEPTPENRVHDANEAAELMAQVMQLLRDAPANAEDDILAWRRCYWLVSTLSLIPGLEGCIRQCQEDEKWRLLPDTGDDSPATETDYVVTLPGELETLKRDEDLKFSMVDEQGTVFNEEFPDRFFPVVFIDQPAKR